MYLQYPFVTNYDLSRLALQLDFCLIVPEYFSFTLKLPVQILPCENS